MACGGGTGRRCGRLKEGRAGKGMEYTLSWTPPESLSLTLITNSHLFLFHIFNLSYCCFCFKVVFFFFVSNVVYALAARGLGAHLLRSYTGTVCFQLYLLILCRIVRKKMMRIRKDKVVLEG